MISSFCEILYYSSTWRLHRVLEWDMVKERVVNVLRWHDYSYCDAALH